MDTSGKQEEEQLEKSRESDSFSENGEATAEGREALPRLPAPETKAPVQFNTQINVQQIPKTAWDRLSPDQVLDLSKAILQNADTIDSRHFEFAMKQAEREESGKKLGIGVGAAVSVAAYGLSALLAYNGHDLVAACIALPVTTVLAMIVGNRFLD